MTETIEETTEFPEDMRLFNIGIWAGTFSWLVLILGIGQTILTFIQSNGYGAYANMTAQGEPVFRILMILSDANSLIRAIFFWFFLQALKQLLFLMIDIKEFLIEKQ